MRKLYADISEHNSVTSLSALDGVMIRAGCGDEVGGAVDKKLFQHVKLAEKAGIPYGFYWYGYSQTPEQAKSEAAFCLKTIKKYKPTLPIAYDLEDGDGYKAAHGGIPSKSVNTQIVINFCEALEDAGYYAMYYVNYDWWANRVNHTKLEDYALWLAWWGRDTKPDVASNEFMWQYTSDGKVKGISGRVDLNYCYVDFVSAIKENGLNGYTPTGSGSTKPTTEIEEGDKVKVLKAVQYDNGKSFGVYYNTYDVIEAKGDRIVIGIGNKVTAAVHRKNLKKV